MSYDLVPDISLPKIVLDQVTHQMFVDANELSSEDSSCVAVGGERLKTLIITKDLGGRSGGHRGY